MAKYRPQKYSSCQLIAAINARIFLGGEDVSEEDFERLVDETFGRIGSCIGVENAYSELRLTSKSSRTSLRWIKRHLPVSISIFDPKYGYHVVLIVAAQGRKVKLVNAWKKWVAWKTIRRLLPKWEHQRTCQSYMPTYTYQCKSCEHRFDVLQRIADPDPKCEECGKKVERIIMPPAGIHFKGTGFYETDYKNK